MNLIIRFLIITLFIVSMAHTHMSKSCAGCVGRLEKNSPAFFTDEYYKATDADEIDTHDAIISEQQDNKNACAPTVEGESCAS